MVSRTSSRRRFLIAPALAAVAVLGGSAFRASGASGGFAAAQHDGAPTQYAESLGHPSPLRGGDPATLLGSALARDGGGQVLDAAVIPRPSTLDRSGVWLHFTVPVESKATPSVRGLWEANEVQGAVADATAALPDPQHVVGSVIDGRLPDGELMGNVGGGMGDVTPGQAFRDPSDATLEDTLRGGLEAAGLDAVSVAALRVDQAAPIVIGQTTDPKQAALTAQATTHTLFGPESANYEGFYFEVDDTSGNPVYVTAAAFRTGAGFLWYDPSVADVISISHAATLRGTRGRVAHAHKAAHHVAFPDLAR